MAQICQVVLTEAGEHCNGEQLCRAVAAPFDRRLHETSARVDCQESGDALLGNLPRGTLHCLRNVIEFQIQEDLLAGRGDFGNKRHPAGRIQFHTDLVEAGCGTDFFNQLKGGCCSVDIQGNDQGIQIVTSIGLSSRAFTRPMTYISCRWAMSLRASCSLSESSKPPEVCGS